MNKPTNRAVGANADEAPAHTTPAHTASIRTIDSQELLGSQGVLYIRHQNEVYRLQTTRFGKLILTK